MRLNYRRRLASSRRAPAEDAESGLQTQREHDERRASGTNGGFGAVTRRRAVLERDQAERDHGKQLLTKPAQLALSVQTSTMEYRLFSRSGVCRAEQVTAPARALFARSLY